jgi:mono/diheme cytochrome c family protein
MRRVAFTAVPLAALALVAAGCGSQGVQVPKDDQYHRGAVLFAENCSGCHTLSEDGTEGSADNVRDKEHTDGPNFNTRKETVETVLYAIENGGFSGAIMPENIVTGDDALAVAKFLAKYSGKDAKQQATLDGDETSTTETTPQLDNTTEPQ